MELSRLRNIIFLLLSGMMILRIMLQTTENTSSWEEPLLESRLPDAIIIGGRKCGTRALLEFLSLHPRIKTAEHEAHFFDNDTNFVKGPSWYLKQLPLSGPGDIIIEKTPSYLVKRTVPKRIFDLLPSVKFIVILRDPVVRAISDYTQVDHVKHSRRKTHKFFSELAFNSLGDVNIHYKPIKNGLYHPHLLNWLKYFQLSSFHFVNGDNFILDPIQELDKVQDFLNIDRHIVPTMLFLNRTKGFYCYYKPPENEQHCLSDTKGRPHAKVSIGIKNKLRNFYKPYNEKLYQLVNKSFNWY